ncbi:MAG TPA: hypothetical protein VLG12_03360 [Candidatus Saccharimonadales bacterium]|nr:hypothetical protein [Candidatus Saccharimonadales bacterium]
MVAGIVAACLFYPGFSGLLSYAAFAERGNTKQFLKTYSLIAILWITASIALLFTKGGITSFMVFLGSSFFLTVFLICCHELATIKCPVRTAYYQELMDCCGDLMRLDGKLAAAYLMVTSRLLDVLPQVDFWIRVIYSILGVPLFLSLTCVSIGLPVYIAFFVK